MNSKKIADIKPKPLTLKTLPKYVKFIIEHGETPKSFIKNMKKEYYENVKELEKNLKPTITLAALDIPTTSLQLDKFIKEYEGGSKLKPKRKVKSVIKAKPKRKVKSIVKRKVKSVVKSKPKRKVKSMVKRKVKSAVKAKPKRK